MIYRIALIVGLLVLSGCGPSEEQQARDAFDRGIAHAEKDQLDEAIDEYTEAIRLNPQCALAYSNRGDAYRKKGEFDKAIVDCTEAIRLDPKDAQALSHRGYAYPGPTSSASVSHVSPKTRTKNRDHP